MKFGIGAAVRRNEDAAFITGRGRYIADAAPEATAWAHVLRSPVGHADFRFTDVEAARAMPGVLAVLTGEDVADLGPLPCIGADMMHRDGGAPETLPLQPVLAQDRVRYVGQPLAMVIAETPDAARDAAEAIGFEFDELPAVGDVESAVADDAPRIWSDIPGNIAFDWQIGPAEEVEAAFAGAARTVSVTLANNRVVANYMEPRGAIAEYDAQADRLTLTVGSQGPHSMQAIIANKVLGISRERLRVVTPDVGGGFGTKIFVYPEYPVVLLAAERLGRPVTWLADRTEHFVADYQGRAHTSRAELAVDEKGRFLAMRVHTRAEMGAYFSQMGPFVPTNGSFMVAGSYRTPLAHVRVQGVFTNTVPVDAYRGAGRPEAAYLIERLVDKAARELAIAPDVIRRRNFIRPSSMPYKVATGRVYDTGEFDGHMRRAMEVADWKGFKARLREARKRGRVRGIGLATYIEACSGGAAERATVRFETDGTVTVLIGSQSNGQGHATAYAQLVSDKLGIDPARVKVVQGDTDRVRTGTGTGGSRSIPVGGSSVAQASAQLAERVRTLAGEMLEAGAGDIELDADGARIAGTDRAVSFADIAARGADESGEAMTESEAWQPPGQTFPNGTHLVEVEIDPETGRVEIVNYVAVDDFGVTLNPLLLEGQVVGGIAQGLGQALMERTVYEADTGQLVTATFQDYAVPRAADVPSVHFETRNVPSTTNAMGMKGAGEAGAIGACPAIVNAVVDALHRETGATHIDMPITPETLWRALSGRGAA